MIPRAKLYGPNLLKNDNTKFLENIMRRFARTFYQNNYRSEVTRQPKTMIWALRLPQFKVGENDPTRNSFLNYYMLLVEIKDLMP